MYISLHLGCHWKVIRAMIHVAQTTYITQSASCVAIVTASCSATTMRAVPAVLDSLTMFLTKC